MRRLFLLALTVLLGLVGTACDPELSRKTSGTYTATTSFGPGSGCSVVFITSDGSYVRREGAPGGDLHQEGCIRTGELNGAFGFIFEGTFTLVTAGGAVIRGTAASSRVSQSDQGPFQQIMTVTSGTKAFAGATGIIIMDAVATLLPEGGGQSLEGELTGLLTSQSGDQIAI
jgi:hypothetical protein